MSDKDITIRSIVKQWNGGEHILAGARASELVFGKKKKADDKMLQALAEQVPGIERYITAPTSDPVTIVEDQGGNPLARQPENQPGATGASNVSSDTAKGEQDAIDDALAAGREAREAAGANGGIGSTELNPSQSNEGGPAKPPVEA